MSVNAFPGMSGKTISHRTVAQIGFRQLVACIPRLIQRSPKELVPNRPEMGYPLSFPGPGCRLGDALRTDGWFFGRSTGGDLG